MGLQKSVCRRNTTWGTPKPPGSRGVGEKKKRTYWAGGGTRDRMGGWEEKGIRKQKSKLSGCGPLCDKGETTMGRKLKANKP